MARIFSALSAATLASAFQDDGCSQEGFSAGGSAQGYWMTDAADNLGAKCLDGTPGVYYLQEGSGDGANKWYIHHEGGGWCESMDDCLSRSQGTLGSSSTYPQTANLGDGYFSTDAGVNPMMHNWNHVKMRYCDGASFSGNNDTVAEYKGTQLYFRGKRIREAMAKDLFDSRGLKDATDLVVSGCSAGGLATFLHTDQWCDALKAVNPSAKCVGLPDSGFFLDYQDPEVTCQPESVEQGLGVSNTINGNYHCGLKWTFTVQNATAGVHEDCIAQHAGEEWKCMFAEHSSEHIHSPVFAMQSQYDSWQTGHVQGNGGDAKTQELGDNVTARIQSMLMKNNPESGAFLDSCHHHCGNWNAIRIEGDVISTAFQKWYDGIGTPGNKKLWNQNQAYPCDSCCSAASEELV
jgi:hypothetical protein